MYWNVPTINLLLAWIWILLGFGSGALLGLRVARENWLGGYTSLRRRMYRLGHISLLGLGILNLLFFLTVQAEPGLAGRPIAWASSLFIVGALTMPACCLVLAHHPDTAPPALFSLPVGSLLIGGGILLWMLVTS